MSISGFPAFVEDMAVRGEQGLGYTWDWVGGGTWGWEVVRADAEGVRARERGQLNGPDIG